MNDKAGISAVQLMIDTATRQTEKLTNELAEVREKQRVLTEVWRRPQGKKPVTLQNLPRRRRRGRRK